jgi:hypothetical protein
MTNGKKTTRMCTEKWVFECEISDKTGVGDKNPELIFSSTMTE